MARIHSTAAAPDRRPEGAYDREATQEIVQKLEGISWDAPARAALLVESPRSGQREVREEVRIVEGKGLAGDYERKDFYKGERVPGREVSAMAREVIEVLGADPVSIGDNLVTEGVDLKALRPGDRLNVGGEVVLRRSERPHRPCASFRERTSPESFAAVARADYRGALFYVEQGGVVRTGATIEVTKS